MAEKGGDLARESGMNAQHERILGIIADLAVDGQEVDEFSVAQACGAIPDNLPRHAWVNHPCRGELLRAFSCLDQGKLIYVTKRGYWGMHLTQRGRQVLEPHPRPAPAPITLLPLASDLPTPPPLDAQDWVAPRMAAPEFAPRQDHFYSTLALAVAGLGALLIFAFGQSAYNPLARNSAAASNDQATPSVAIVLPTVPATTPTPAVQPTAVPVRRAFVVANTGGDGVFLRRSAGNGERIAAWAEQTPLEEVGPEVTIGGIVWRHVRTPDGTVGFVPAQYTVQAR